ncbi:MAG: helix-turn-helix transcriptional regulator [Deltaproteobacteria bacterium]
MGRKNHEALKKLEKLIGEPVTFGLYLKSIREAEELLQSEFAEKLGISVQHLSNVENGRKHVSIERAEAWGKALGYPEAMFVQLSLQDQFQRAGLDGYELTVKKAS